MSESTIQEFLTVFNSLFQVGSDNIDGNTKFRDLDEWSSMQALIVIAAVDEHYGVTIVERDFRGATTVADLHQLTSGS
jgi:acyl carrier protein